MWGGITVYKENKIITNKTKRIDLRVSETDLVKIDGKAACAKLSRSAYMIAAALDKNITVIDDGKKIAHQLFKIGSSVNQLTMLAHQGKIQVVYMDKFREEVKTVWQSLNALINPTEPTQE